MSARRRPRQAPARVTTPAAGPNNPPDWLIYLLLVVLTFIAYAPLFTSAGGWLWDDNGHVTRAGLQTADGLRRIWFKIGATQQYYPIVHSAFWMNRICSARPIRSRITRFRYCSTPPLRSYCF